MKTAWALAVLLCGTVLAQDADTGAIGKERHLLILKALRKTKQRWEGTSEEFVSAVPLFRGVAKVSVQWGLNRDPTPDPFVYYATPDNRIVSSFAEALEAMRYVPRDLEDALRVGVLLVGEQDRHATVIEDEQNVEAIPRQVCREHKVKPASGKRTDDDTYRFVVFTYQPHQQGGFTRHHREEALNRHVVTIEKHRYDCQVEQLLHGLLRSK